MRISRLFMGVALLIAVTLTGCQSIPFLGGKSGQVPPTVEVKRGVLETTITADGKITLPRTTRLGFSGGVWGTYAGNALLSELNISTGSKVTRGQVLASLDTSIQERNLPKHKNNIKAALLALDKVKEPLYKPEEIAKAEAAIIMATANLEYAREDLKDVKEPYTTPWSKKPFTENDFVNAEAAVRNAGTALASAEQELETAKQDWNLKIQEAKDQIFPEKTSPRLVLEVSTEQEERKLLETLELVKKQAETAITKAENNVDKAGDTLSDAEFTLNDMLSKKEGDPLIIKQKETALVNSEVALLTAQQNLALMKREPEPVDIKLKEVQVEAAQLALDEAMQQIKESKIIAPFDGIIGDFQAKAGDAVQPVSFFIPLVDPTKVRIDAEIEEFDVISVRPGMPAVITLDAFEEQTFTGTVNTIAPVASEQHGVVLYDATIDVKSPEAGPTGIELRGGLSVTVNINTDTKENVLLVPKRSVISQGGEYKVQVLSGDKVQDRVVKVGLSNKQFTEIVEGLVEGEKVVVQDLS